MYVLSRRILPGCVSLTTGLHRSQCTAMQSQTGMIRGSTGTRVKIETRTAACTVKSETAFSIRMTAILPLNIRLSPASSNPYSNRLFPFELDRMCPNFLSLLRLTSKKLCRSSVGKKIYLCIQNKLPEIEVASLW